MKTVIVMIVVGVIAFFSIRSLVKSLKGEGGCGCSKSESDNCSIKKSCSSKKDKNQ